MKKMHYYGIILTATIILYSCDNSSVIDGKNPLSDIAKSLSLQNDSCDAVLYAIGSYDYMNPSNNNVYVSAYLTDGYNFVDPTFISANNSLLVNMDEDDPAVGQLHGIFEPFPQTQPYVISWVINGWAGYNYFGEQILANPMLFTSLNYLDTISASNGLNISYTGAEMTGYVDIRITHAIGENDIFLGNYPVGYKSISLRTVDDGSVSISSTDIANLPKNYYYEIILSHSKSSTETISNRKLLKHSDYITSTCIYLIN